MVCRLCQEEQTQIKEIRIARTCENCQRNEDVETSQPRMYDVSGDLMSCTRTYCHLKGSDVSSRDVVLCRECAIYVHPRHNIKTYQQWQYFWPAYVWQLLSCDYLTKQQAMEVWKFIPYQLRLR